VESFEPGLRFGDAEADTLENETRDCAAVVVIINNENEGREQLG